MKRQILRKDCDENPYLKWNTFIDLIAIEAYEDLSDIQKKAQLLFYYNQEVQNGGIVQYFTNQGIDYLDELKEAFHFFDAQEHLNSLQNVLNIYKTISLDEFSNEKEFISNTMVGYDYVFPDDLMEKQYDQHIQNFENWYYKYQPSIDDILTCTLEKYEAEFIEMLE